MKTLKVFLSPSYKYDVYIDEVTNTKFENGRGIEVHSIDMEGSDLSGIQSALRKNILLPFDAETRDYVNATNLAEKPKATKPVSNEPKEVPELTVETKEEPVMEEKPVRKKAKKDSK